VSLPHTHDPRRLIEARRHELADRVCKHAATVAALTAQRDQAMAERDQVIAEAKAEGLTYARIAELIGYSLRGVQLIVGRTKAASRTADVA